MTVQGELSQQVEQDLAEYRSLSLGAVAAVVLGILSAAAVIGPLLWLIPAAALLVSLIALWRIKASQGRLIGHSAAILGLVLAIFFLGAGPARTLTHRYWLQVRAERFARGFFDYLLQGKGYDAHQLTRAWGLRKPLANDAEPYAKDPDAKKDFDNFLKYGPIKALLNVNSKAHIKSLTANPLGGDDRGERVDVRYCIEVPDEPESKSITGHVDLYRFQTRDTGQEGWQVLTSTFRTDTQEED